MSRKKMEESLAMLNNGELHSDDVSSTSEEADPSSQEPDIPSIVVVVDPVEDGREVSGVITWRILASAHSFIQFTEEFGILVQ